MATPLIRDVTPHLLPFGAEEMNRVLAPQEGPCVSIYLPTDRRHPGWKQDPVRYRTLLSEARRLLETRYMSRNVEEFLEPLQAMCQGRHWEFSLDGLAVFHSKRFFAGYRLPIPVPERVIVADTFHTKPLLRFLRSNQRYLVLAVSQKSVELYQGSPFGAGLVGLLGLPQGLLELLNDTSPYVRAVAVESLGHLKDARSTPALLEALARDADKRVRLGAATGALAHLLPQALRGLAAARPEIDVQVAVLTSAETLARLAAGTLDLGVVALPQPAVRGLAIRRWRRR